MVNTFFLKGVPKIRVISQDYGTSEEGFRDMRYDKCTPRGGICVDFDECCEKDNICGKSQNYDGVDNEKICDVSIIRLPGKLTNLLHI